MFPRKSRRERRGGRGRFRPGLGLGHGTGPGSAPGAGVAPECLEPRLLMAYSSKGFSLPDLIVSGFASPAGSWGKPLTVTVNVSNIGASTMIEPLALDVGATSSADAPASTVAVYAVRTPYSLRGAVQVGTVDIPAVRQNSSLQISQTITLPAQPPGFPGDGGRVYLVFKANASGVVHESDATNNVSAPTPLQIVAPLPELAVVGFDVPPVMQPGDVIQPNIRIANFGPADTAPQGPVGVALVASTTPNFQPGFSSVIATYFVPNVPGVQNISNKAPVFADANQTPQLNVVTITGNPVKLPAGPQLYYIGVVIDPLNRLKQLGNVATFQAPTNNFSLPRVVGPPIVGLPPAGQLVTGGASNVPVFPNPFGGILIGGSLDGATFPAPYPPPATPPLPAITTSAGSSVIPPVLLGGVTPGITAASASQSRGSFRAVLGHSPLSAMSTTPVTQTYAAISPTRGRRVAARLD